MGCVTYKLIGQICLTLQYETSKTRKKEARNESDSNASHQDLNL